MAKVSIINSIFFILGEENESKSSRRNRAAVKILTHVVRSVTPNSFSQYNRLG